MNTKFFASFAFAVGLLAVGGLQAMNNNQNNGQNNGQNTNLNIVALVNQQQNNQKPIPNPAIMAVNSPFKPTPLILQAPKKQPQNPGQPSRSSNASVRRQLFF